MRLRWLLEKAAKVGSPVEVEVVALHPTTDLRAAPVAMAEMGLAVGLVDADIYGHSIPRMLGATDAPHMVEGMIMPPHPMYPGTDHHSYYKGEVKGSHPSQEVNK